jgi:hypothetical protein
MKNFDLIKSEKLNLVRSLSILMFQIGTVLIFTQAAVASGAGKSSRTEGRYETDCNCDLDKASSFKAKKQNLIDIAKIVDEASKPDYYYKYHIDEFLKEVAEKAPRYKHQAEIKFKNLLPDFNPQVQDSVLDVNANKGAMEGDVTLSLTRIIGRLGQDIPAISKIAESYIVKLRMNARSNDTGMEIGGQKVISIESNKNAQSDHQIGFSYASCSQSSTLVNVGTKMGCSYSDKVSGSYEQRVVRGVYVGGTFTDSLGAGGNMPEGGVYFRVEF